MKSLKALISLALTLAIILSVGTVYATTDLGGGYLGYKLNAGTLTSVNDGTLSVIQPSEDVYYYVDNNNLYNNPSFELSNEVNNPAKLASLEEFTNSWLSTNEIRNTRLTLSITDNAHSGSNALKIVKADETSSEIRIFNSIADASLSGKQQCATTNLNEDETYIVSFWVKGSAISAIQYRQSADAGASYVFAKNYATVETQDVWELVSLEINPYEYSTDVYGIWADVYFSGSNLTVDEYIIVDDIQLTTKTQAFENVVTMIDNLDITLSTAERAIDDITQWVAVLGSENISNYADFEKKVEDYSKYGVYEYVNSNGAAPKNGTFEASDEAEILHRRSDVFFDITDGWMTNWTMNSTDKPFQSASISDDAHSGNNSLKVTITSNDSKSYNLIVYNNEAIKDTATSVSYMQYDSPNTTYKVSVWLKGAKVLGGTKTYNEPADESSSGSWNTSSSWATKMQEDAGENWKLYTFDIKTNSLGQACWFIQIPHTANATLEVYLDDIHVATKEQYIANVEAMIKNLDTSKSYSARAIDDIEQWISVLGSENISNYDLFEMKKSGYVYYDASTSLVNTGFEASDSAEITANKTGTYKEITTGWVANHTTAGMQVAEISSDAHSGNNAFKVSVTNNDTEAGKSLYYNLPIYSSNISDSGNPIYKFDKANTTYIVSAWVKGAKLRGGTRTYDETTGEWGSGTSWQTVMENDAGEKWTLYTFNITTNSLGQAWWFINVPQVIDTTVSVIIDDIQVLTLEDNIKLVDSLIDQLAKLDKSSNEYARAKADIEQWLPVLDSADLNLKYDIVLNEKYNIITPNEGYTHLAQGDYIASVTLKGKGEVNRVYGDNITNITSILTELIDEYVTHRERVTVGAYGTYYMGVQLLDTTAINTVDVKNFSLKRVGDVNESGKIDIRDMVRMVKGLNGTDASVDELVADYDNSTAFDSADIAALREKIMNTDKLADVLRGKTVSVIGDSISTFKGYNNNIYSNTTTVNNSVCYYDGKPNKYDEYGNYQDWQDMKVDDTYWKQIIDITETRLLVNNAWSGSSIARQGGAKRGIQLHDNYGYYNGETPDIILVHYGTNDYLSFLSQGDEAYGVESFAASYDEMVAAMLETYEDVDIYLFTFPHYRTNEEHIAIQQEYNDAIRATAEKYGCRLVDLHNNSAFNLETFKELTVDGLHPNKAGMDAITDTLYNVMCEQYIK